MQGNVTVRGPGAVQRPRADAHSRLQLGSLVAHPVLGRRATKVESCALSLAARAVIAAG